MGLRIRKGKTNYGASSLSLLQTINKLIYHNPLKKQIKRYNTLKRRKKRRKMCLEAER